MVLPWPEIWQRLLDRARDKAYDMGQYTDLVLCHWRLDVCAAWEGGTYVSNLLHLSLQGDELFWVD